MAPTPPPTAHSVLASVCWPACAGQRVLADTVSLNSQVENFMDTEVEHGDAEVLQAVNLPEADIQKVTPCHIMHMLAVPLLLPPV